MPGTEGKVLFLQQFKNKIKWRYLCKINFHVHNVLFEKHIFIILSYYIITGNKIIHIIHSFVFVSKIWSKSNFRCGSKEFNKNGFWHIHLRCKKINLNFHCEYWASAQPKGQSSSLRNLGRQFRFWSVTEKNWNENFSWYKNGRMSEMVLYK